MRQGISSGIMISMWVSQARVTTAALICTQGLVTSDRGDELEGHLQHFARDDNNGQQFKTLAEVVEYVKPTMLIGLSTVHGLFDKNILTRMGQLNDRPVIFPLSNPSNHSECTFEEALNCTEGRAIFASGSPYDPIEYNGTLRFPGQGQSSSSCLRNHDSWD